MLPEWLYPWVPYAWVGAQVLLILLAAWGLRTLLGHLVPRTGARHNLPPELSLLLLRAGRLLIYAAALLLVLDRLGVSATVFWTAFTGFAAVAAVAFFAAWSVLSNIFCSLLIFTTRIIRLHDTVEVIENGQFKGVKGEVIDINLIYTTLQESRDDGHHTRLHLPNSMFFQRITRRWDNPPLAQPLPSLPPAEVQVAEAVAR